MAATLKITRLARCLRLSANSVGRDFVVGDLHGHRALFERALEQVAFDPARDRVISVGDLVDRGPDSLGTLALIEEPWFHAVLGNHELMLLNDLGYYDSRVHARRAWPHGSGHWIHEAALRHRKLLRRLADRAADLPLSIHVDGEVPFNVMHGDLHPVGSRQEHLFRDESICVHKADVLATSRGNIRTALPSDMLGLQFDQHEVRISATPRSGLPITYVGHSPLAQVTVHNSYVYIDQGICLRPGKQPVGPVPTLLEHRRFAYWLGGVATARSRGRATATRLERA